MLGTMPWFVWKNAQWVYGQDANVQCVGRHLHFLIPKSFEPAHKLSSEPHLKSGTILSNHLQLIPWIKENVKSGIQSGASARFR